jgi:hypothetical protein
LFVRNPSLISSFSDFCGVNRESLDDSVISSGDCDFYSIMSDRKISPDRPERETF